MRSKVLGYIEQGTTTTSFDMQVANRTSRFHVVMEALLMASKSNSDVSKSISQNIQFIEEKLRLHSQYIQENGDDMDEIKIWKWK
ncbi:MAG: hypothetical protein HC932_06060 [Thermales bacterium]|nr:hypothetical protein [Thermales bacterium]